MLQYTFVRVWPLKSSHICVFVFINHEFVWQFLTVFTITVNNVILSTYLSNSLSLTVCLHLKMEFRSCARERQWLGIFHYHWWTASIKPRLLFSHSGLVSWGLPFLQFSINELVIHHDLCTLFLTNLFWLNGIAVLVDKLSIIKTCSFHIMFLIDYLT